MVNFSVVLVSLLLLSQLSISLAWQAAESDRLAKDLTLELDYASFPEWNAYPGTDWQTVSEELWNPGPLQHIEPRVPEPRISLLLSALLAVCAFLHWQVNGDPGWLKRRC